MSAILKMVNLTYYFELATESSIELAEKLNEFAPVPISKTFFTNSESEAIDSAVKMLWMLNLETGKPSKCKIITRFGTYHGLTSIASIARHVHFDY